MCSRSLISKLIFLFSQFIQVLRGLPSHQGCDSTSSEGKGSYQTEEQWQEIIQFIFEVWLKNKIWRRVYVICWNVIKKLYTSAQTLHSYSCEIWHVGCVVSREYDSKRISQPRTTHLRHFTSDSFVFQHRYLMKLTTMVKLFGSVSDRKKNLNLCHQDLLEMKGALTRFEDLPMGSFVMFVSHQWNGHHHPDPHGRQLEVLCKVMRDLRDGSHNNVSTDPYHILLYITKTTTHKSEWQTLLSNTYVWYVILDI